MTPEDLQQQLSLSDAVMTRLLAFDQYFMEQAAIHNLVARGSLPERWQRHYLDSAQLYRLIPEGADSLIDLGSGAGFPGLILAAMGVNNGLAVTLVESIGKKARFLRDAARAMGLDNVQVLQERIEVVSLSKPPGILTARALASLEKLCTLAYPLTGPQTICLFPKGGKASEELTVVREHWHISVKDHPSMTSPEGVILEIRDLVPHKA